MLYDLLSSLLPLIAIIMGCSFISVLWHELGHAIPILLMTKGKVTIYIGSFGDEKNCWKVTLKSLIVYCKYNPLMWRGGLCKPPQEPISLNKRILYVATGPIATVILTIISWFLISKIEQPGLPGFFAMVLFGWGLLYSFSCILPINLSKRNINGKRQLNDCNLILQMLKTRKYQTEVEAIDDQIKSQDYQNASDRLQVLISQHTTDITLYRLAVWANIKAKNYQAAMQYSAILLERFEPLAADYINAGVLQERTGLHEQEMAYYKKALDLKEDHPYALNNLGYTLATYFDRYGEAIVFLEKAMVADPFFSHPYNNRGFIKIQTGQLEEAFSDISYALQLDAQNAYAYRNLGIYYFKKNSFIESKIQFEKAKALEHDIPMTDEFLERINQQTFVNISSEDHKN